jgi:hypothetical protein
MSLFNSQTIFNILITLIICSALFIFFRFKLRVLEISQREQAKVLQSLVMNIRHGGHPRNADMDMENSQEAMKHIQMMQMQTQMQQAGASEHARRANDLIDVSDEEDDDDDDDDTDSSSDSGDDDNDSSSSEDENDDNDDNDENHETTTKKIIFNNGGALDTHAHNVEHLTGDDIKVIELSEPLYPVGGNAHGSKNSSHHDTNDVSDDDDDENDNEDMSDDDNDDEETSDDTEVKAEELPSHEHEHQQHLETSVTDIDTTEIKTIFKADKQQQQQQQQQSHHTDYNSMNVQTLKQQLKTKLSAEGMPYNETAINKLNKKELIKHLTQG